MADLGQITYNDDLSTDRDKIRFFIGDKVYGKGPKPMIDDEDPICTNFTDDELDGMIALSGSWEEAVANAYDTLAALWVPFPTYQADNFAISRSHIARNFQEQAKLWRDTHGLAGGSYKFGAAGSRPITRVDAYSDDLDSVTE